LFFSAASGWEVVIKARLGKLQVPDDPERFLTEQLSRTAILVLSVHHRHPFDRLLISQVLLENLPVLSADSQLARYEVEVLG
jgi:PIN domain nuclease of toxin-antitoxin system